MSIRHDKGGGRSKKKKKKKKKKKCYIIFEWPHLLRNSLLIQKIGTYFLTLREHRTPGGPAESQSGDLNGSCDNDLPSFKPTTVEI